MQAELGAAGNPRNGKNESVIVNRNFNEHFHFKLLT